MTPLSRLNRFPRQSRRKSTTMRWWDLAALTAIFFGPAMYASMQASLAIPDAFDPTVPEFSTSTNWVALLQQSLLLAVGIAYICGRRISLLPWSMRPSFKGLGLGVCLFAFTGLVFDMVYTLYGYFAPTPAPVTEPNQDPEQGVDASLLSYSLFNSFYEEFFFLVICLSGSRQTRPWAFVYSLMVRVSFHTYQGIFNALMIGVVFGALSYAATRFFSALTTRSGQWIFPIVVAHALTDVFGTGLISLFFPEQGGNPGLGQH